MIAGGGVAGLEAMLAIRDLGGDRVDVELLSPEHHFWYRPLSVAEPFGLAHAHRFELADLAAAAGAAFTPGALVAPSTPIGASPTSARRVDLEYDALVVACGTKAIPALDAALTFRAHPTSSASRRCSPSSRPERPPGRVRAPGGMPAGLSPLYELALLTATHLDERRITNAELALVTPEPAPLALLGPSGSEAVAALLAERLVRVHVNDRPERFADGRLQLASGVALEADRVVALAQLEGHRVEGIPHDRDGFVATRHDGLVEGLDHVYAAGDITRFGVRQGGIAAQQADVVAGTIAARAGADAESPVFEPVLRTLLLTGGQPLYLSAELGGDDPDWEVSTEPLWSPPSKIVGRYLAPFLAARTPAERTTPGYSPAGVGRSYRSRSQAALR